MSKANLVLVHDGALPPLTPDQTVRPKSPPHSLRSKPIHGSTAMVEALDAMSAFLRLPTYRQRRIARRGVNHG